jgi:hypothetical protein
VSEKNEVGRGFATQASVLRQNQENKNLKKIKEKRG